MRKAVIDEANRHQIARQNEFRAAADLVVKAWSRFPEIAAIAITGSAAKPLWKEVPRFSPFRQKGVELWHECGDLDLAVWLDSQQRLGELRRVKDQTLREAVEADSGVRVASHQVDTFLFEPDTDRYLGRLCAFAQCPKGKRDCLTPGCGAIPFNKVIDGFVPWDDLLVSAKVLYRRDTGIVLRAVDLPSVRNE